MKRILIAVTVLFLLAAFSGCTKAGNAHSSNAPQLTQPVTTVPSSATPEPSPIPEETKAEPNRYTSSGLGLSFAVPDNWVGKYRVEEGTGYLSVYFTPATPIGENSWSGELFSITKSGSFDYDVCNMYGEWEFQMDSSTYVFGLFDGMAYDRKAPESDFFLAMKSDIQTVFSSMTTLSNDQPTEVKRLWIDVVPNTTEYNTSLGLGLSFTLPVDWIGKCKLLEETDSVSFYFTPKDPDPFDSGEGFIFMIGEVNDKLNGSGLDGVREFSVNGHKYYAGGATDVEYDGPEQEIYDVMFSGIEKIIDSVSAVT